MNYIAKLQKDFNLLEHEYYSKIRDTLQKLIEVYEPQIVIYKSSTIYKYGVRYNDYLFFFDIKYDEDGKLNLKGSRPSINSQMSEKERELSNNAFDYVKTILRQALQ